MADKKDFLGNLALYIFSKRISRFVSIVILGLILIVASVYWGGYVIECNLRHQGQVQMLRTEVMNLSAQGHEMRDAKNNYLLHKDPGYAIQHNSLANRALNTVAKIRDNASVFLIQKPLNSLSNHLQQQIQQFDLVSLRSQKVGLTEKDGLQHKVRSLAHSLENTIKEINIDTLMIEVLMIRRHEKDFLVRGDKSSLLGMKQQLSFFDDKLQLIPLFLSDKHHIKELVKNYTTFFNQLVEERAKLEMESNKLTATYKDFFLILDNTLSYLQIQSDASAAQIMKKLLLFKTLLGIFATILILITGLQGIIIVRQITKGSVSV